MRASRELIALALAWAVGLILAVGPRLASAAPETTDAELSVDGGQDAAPDASADASAEHVAARLRDELASLTAFRDGRLGTQRASDLFTVDLADDAAVRTRLEAVKKELDKARAAARRAHADAGTPEDLRAQVLEVRANILALPHDRREELLTLEAHAVAAEAARAEHERAEREAKDAEAARRHALDAADRARSSVERRIAEARATVEQAREKQLRAKGELADHRRDLTQADDERDARVERLRREAATVEPESAASDALYDRIVGELVDLRARAGALLDDLQHQTKTAVPSVDLPDTDDPGLAAERDQVRTALQAITHDAALLDSEKKELSWSALRSVMDAERSLNGERISLLDRVTQPKRDSVLGFGDEGRAQGARELERMRLEIRFLRASGDRLVEDALASIRRPAVIARVSFHAVAFIALVWAAAVVRRRHAKWLRLLRNGAARAFRRPAFLRAFQRLTSALIAVGPELVVLAAVLLVPDVTRIDVHVAPWSIAYSLVLWYALYRVVLAVTHRTLAWFAAREDEAVAPETGRKILRSVRLVGRSAFAFVILLAGSAAVVGRGYLYGLVVRAAWVIGAFLAFVLVSRWRDDIAEAYLHVRPTGTLSGVVARTRKRRAGFFVAFAAFAVLFVGGAAGGVRRFVLGFEHSRKALAYMFRRRLEKQIEHVVDDDRALLDAGALAFFTESPVEEESLVVERFPGMEALDARYDAWKRGERSGAVLVVGRTGYGKTTWISHALARMPAEKVDRICVRERATREDEVIRALAAELGAPPSAAAGVDALAAWLLSGERRIIVLDDAQLWFLRGLDSLEGLRALSLLVDRSSERVLWIVAFAHYAWELAKWTAKGEHVFRSIVHLAPWSEAEIASLLAKRNAASGLRIVYDDLLVDEAGIDDERRLLTTVRDYNRLVWDYAEGSPRVALHVWARSLVPDGPGAARVRLFVNPQAQLLEELNEAARFVVAAIVWHDGLTVAEAAATLQLPESACEDAFARLFEQDIAVVERGRVRIAPSWWPVVVRFLRRKHLIAS